MIILQMLECNDNKISISFYVSVQEYVCGDKGVNCSWGQAINVANRYVYVSQPLKDRVLVISKIQMVVVDVSVLLTIGMINEPLIWGMT